ncbi:MAG: hypothetical protein Kow00127_02560 [Bacteroidales bacterium]
MIYAQQFTQGDVHLWELSDFIGLDPVGDNPAETGDITSVYLKSGNKYSILRITFDDMSERLDNSLVADRFSGNDIQIDVQLTDINSKYFWESRFNAGGNKTASDRLMRSPESNMLELALPSIRKRENLEVRISVTVNGIQGDTFSGKGSGSKATGNCAFVHHGNQGLTYTNVFYGNAGGISGLDGSGYDEVLQVHEATGIPGNFHMSGTLMPAAEWHNPEFNDWLESLAQSGIASMMTSALGQHIMPFMTNEMNDWSVYTETQMVEYLYNYTPHVAWVPERVWLAQGNYPDAGVIDWLGDNWAQHGIWGVVLDDSPHLNGYDNRKIHWMNNGMGISLRVIPINNTFVGNMHYDAQAAKNQIASMGQYNICVYGTDWEVAAEMNEHDGTFFLDNYEDVLWYCHDNYPGVKVWKLEDAITNPDFNGTGAEITPGTYGLLGGGDGYGGSNNSWYINWASTPSHSDQHTPVWDYGTVWWDAWSFLMSVNDNSLAQLSWYTMMINLHETGWHTSGQIADWEHRYSSHIKNANVYTEASRWADGAYAVTTAAYTSDIDHDGTDELIMHNDKVFMVFESIGGKANWVFYKNGFGQAYAVVGSDMAYWAETDGDYNESSNNHVAALSDVSPNQQNAVYNITVTDNSGDTVSAVLDQWGVQKTLVLYTGADWLDVMYDFFGQNGYVKSGWSPDLLDLIWSGKSHLERVWGDWGSYCGYRNNASGATAALVLGNGGAQHNLEFEGTLVKGDEIKGWDHFAVRLFAGYTSPLSGTSAPELDAVAAANLDLFPPELSPAAALVNSSQVMLTFNEAVDQTTAENITNYLFSGFAGTYTVASATRQTEWNKVLITLNETLQPGDAGVITVTDVEDLNGNAIDTENQASLTVPNGITPHTVIIDGINDFTETTETMTNTPHHLLITWDNDNLYIGFYSLNLNGGGDLFVNIDTDQLTGSGATTGSWGRVHFTGSYLPEYQVAIEGGGGSMQVNHWNGSGWDYPGNGAIGSSYEGWSNNGLTEIAVPWSALGNPQGVALSVHVTQEDTQVSTEIYPDLNTPGSQAVITWFYAFFTPYIPSGMPAGGLTPGTTPVVPNSPAYITGFSPADSSISILAGDDQLFTISAQDDENDMINYEWKLDGSTVSTDAQFLYQTQPADIGNHILIATAGDGIGTHQPDTVTWSVTVTESLLEVELKVLLQGPYNGGGAMYTSLNEAGLIPLNQPYNQSPWNYSGTESVVSIPGTSVVDWVLIGFRDAPSAAAANSSTQFARTAAFLHNDGTIRTITGNNALQIPHQLSDSLFVVIYHRSHLPVMSAWGLKETNGVYHYDFTQSSSLTVGGSSGIRELANGLWGMAGGDVNADGQIGDSDHNPGWSNEAGIKGYLNADLNLDGEVDNLDKNDIWLPNKGMGSQIIN